MSKALSLRVQRMPWRSRLLFAGGGFPLLWRRWEVVGDFGPVSSFVLRRAARAFIAECQSQLEAERLHDAVMESALTHAEECRPHSKGGPDHCGLCGRQYTPTELELAAWLEAPLYAELPTLLNYIPSQMSIDVDVALRPLLRLTSAWLSAEAGAFDGSLREGILTAARILQLEADRPEVAPQGTDVHSSG